MNIIDYISLIAISNQGLKIQSKTMYSSTLEAVYTRRNYMRHESNGSGTSVVQLDIDASWHRCALMWQARHMDECQMVEPVWHTDVVDAGLEQLRDPLGRAPLSAVGWSIAAVWSSFVVGGRHMDTRVQLKVAANLVRAVKSPACNADWRRAGRGIACRVHDIWWWRSPSQ